MKFLTVILTLFVSTSIFTTAHAQLEAEWKLKLQDDDLFIYLRANNQEEVETFTIDRTLTGFSYDVVAIFGANGSTAQNYFHQDMDLDDGVYGYRLMATYENGDEEIVLEDFVGVNVDISDDEVIQFQKPTQFQTQVQ